MTTSRDAEIQAFTIGEVKLVNGPIVLIDYDPEWPALFRREAARIHSVLGDRVRLLEHTGSTSVPGLAAKPIVDITMAVPDSSDEPAYVPPMEAAGYVLRIREPDWYEHRLFKGPDTKSNSADVDTRTRARPHSAEHEPLLLFSKPGMIVPGS